VVQSVFVVGVLDAGEEVAAALVLLLLPPPPPPHAVRVNASTVAGIARMLKYVISLKVLSGLIYNFSTIDGSIARDSQRQMA